MKNNYQKFGAFSKNGAQALSLMRKEAILPEREKHLRTWNLTEVALMLNKTPQAIRNNEKNKKLPIAKTDARGKRYYTLADINNMRAKLGKLPTDAHSGNPSVIAFTNFKGGVAKTTSAIHAAQYFAKSGYRVLLVDCDSQASATSCFGYAPDEDIAENETLTPYFLGSAKSLKPLIKKTYWDGLDLVPANLTLYAVELELPVIKQAAQKKGKSVQVHRLLSDAISTVKNDYDVVILDCPPAMSILNTNALYAANGIIVPVPPELPDIASMVQFFGMIEGALKMLPSKEYDFLIN